MLGKKQHNNEVVLISDEEIACGIVSHPVTGRWQTWISFHGTDIGCLTAHNRREDADNVAHSIIAAWESGLESQEEVAAFMQSLPSDDVPDPLPQDVVMRLSRKISGK